MPSLKRHSEANDLQQFAAATIDAFAEFDPLQRYVSINATGMQLLQLPEATILGRTNRELVGVSTVAIALHPTLLGIADCVQQVFLTGESCRIIHEFWVEGDRRFYETLYTPIQQEHQIKRVVSVGREITPYWQSHEQLRLKVVATMGNSVHAGALSNSARSPIIGAKMPGLELPQPVVSEATSELFTKTNSLEPRCAVDQSEVAHPEQQPGTQATSSKTLKVDREKAKEILQNVELLQLVLDNIPQYIFWKDLNSAYLGCNRRWAEMAGIGDPENVVGLTDEDLPWTQEQRDWYLECDRLVMDTDTPMLRIKQSQMQADGRQTWRETNKIPIHDPKGEVVGLLGTVEDITEQKLAEDLLRQSEEKFRHLAQREELLNHLINQIRKSLDLKTILNTAVQEVRQFLVTDRVLVYRFDENWSGKVEVEDVGEPWLSTLGEMSQDDCFPNEKAELYQRGRVRAIADITQAGLDSCHIEFLQRLQVQANLIVPINIQSKLWGLLIAHECGSLRTWNEAEISILQQIADQMAIAIRQSELYTSATNNALQAQAQAHRLKQTLEELKKTQAQLIQTEKMSGLGQLVAGIAHEINNPVNFIYGNLSHITSYVEDLTGLIQLYQTHYPSPVPEIVAESEAIDLEFIMEDLVKILQSMRVGTERIRQIVLSLRNFSRLDEAEMKPVDIHEGIESTLLILQHRLKQKIYGSSIQIVKDYGKLPAVECYPGQLNQVFMNLIVNAIDALETWDQERSPEAIQDQPSCLTIRTQLSEDRKRVIVAIADNGPGIPQSAKARLFEPFFTTKPAGKGTGLGLSISYQIIVEKHRGVLRCESESDKGTEFWVEIPIVQRPLGTCKKIKN